MAARFSVGAHQSKETLARRFRPSLCGLEDLIVIALRTTGRRVKGGAWSIAPSSRWSFHPMFRLFEKIGFCLVVYAVLTGCAREAPKRHRWQSRSVNSVDILLAQISAAVEVGDYDEAMRMLHAADVDGMVRTLLDANRGSEHGYYFLAYAEDALLIPGVPLDFETRVIRDRRFREIPGTGDDCPINDPEMRRKWFECVSGFALRFNRKIYRTVRHPDAQKIETNAKDSDRSNAAEQGQR